MKSIRGTSILGISDDLISILVEFDLALKFLKTGKILHYLVLEIL